MQSAHEQVELVRADRGMDLWAAVEAAQFARILRAEQPQREGEMEAMRGFLEALAGCIDGWETTPLESKSRVLQDLGDHLECLEGEGLAVHWCTLEREVQASEERRVRLPVAVVLVGRSRERTATTLIPTTLEAED
jgi:hypothetical protein